MAPSALWNVVLILPGENEVALLAELSRRRDARVVGVVDPTGQSIGTTIAEVMRIPVYSGPEAQPLKDADYWVYPPECAEAQRVVEAAARLGFAAIATPDFLRLLAPPAPPAREPRAEAQPVVRLERETESIHRTLSRIEEALQRESLLRWLLSLATRAVGATAGSIMLHDERSGQLFLACAYGLSDAVVQATRVKLGHGISGRVAQRLRSELVLSQAVSEEPRERPDIAAAVSAPLVHDGRLVGVLNVSVTVGDRLLDERDLATIDRLARRLGLILRRFLDIQRAQEGELFRELDGQLQDLMRGPQDLGAILSRWTAVLGERLGAQALSLALACEDGCLLVAPAPGAGSCEVVHRLPDNAAWNEVLQTGSPLVVREVGAPQAGEPGPRTIFYLPIGAPRVQAILTAAFVAAPDAQRFHHIFGEVAWLLEKRLPELISRFIQRDRLERFAALTAMLTDIAAADPGAPAGCDSPLDLLAAAAGHLTGAAEVFVVTSVEDGVARVAPGNGSPPVPWMETAGRLLEEARGGGWRTTLLSDTIEPRHEETCLLAVTAPETDRAMGLLLAGKRRLHKLDGAVFTEFDAELASRLACLLPALLRRRERPPAPPQPEPAREEAEALMPTEEVAARGRRELLIEALRREMDRCDRYHGAFSLTALRPLALVPWDGATAASLAARLAPMVRTSDLVTSLTDGTLLVMAPEEIQAVSRLERRLVALVRELCGDATLPLATGRALYPGRQDDPEAVLAAAIAALEPLE